MGNRSATIRSNWNLSEMFRPNPPDLSATEALCHAEARAPIAAIENWFGANRKGLQIVSASWRIST
jgi:hypothetical protein